MEKGWQLLLLISVLSEGGKWKLFVFLLVDGCLTVGSLPDYPISCSWYTWSLERLKCLAVHSDLPPALYTCVHVSHLGKELICYQINATLNHPGLVGSLPHLCLFVMLLLASIRIHTNCFSHQRQFFLSFKLLFSLQGGGNKRGKDTLAGQIATVTMDCLQNTVLGEFDNLMSKTDRNERVKIVQPNHIIYNTCTIYNSVSDSKYQIRNQFIQ